MHGADVMIEEILDWRPTAYLTHRTTMPNGFKVVSTFTFADEPEGTRVRLLFKWGKNRREQEAMAPMVQGILAEAVEHGQVALRDLLSEEMARRAALATDAPPEPAPPGSMDRELLEPVKR
jgi:hypothetical protein